MFLLIFFGNFQFFTHPQLGGRWRLLHPATDTFEVSFVKEVGCFIFQRSILIKYWYWWWQWLWEWQWISESCRTCWCEHELDADHLDVADDLDVNLKEEKETKCVGEGVGTKQVCQHLCYVPLLLLVLPNVILVSCSIVVILNVIPVLCPIIIIVSSLKEALYLMTHRNRPHKIFTWPAMHIYF